MDAQNSVEEDEDEDGRVWWVDDDQKPVLNLPFTINDLGGCTKENNMNDIFISNSSSNNSIINTNIKPNNVKIINNINNINDIIKSIKQNKLVYERERRMKKKKKGWDLVWLLCRR